MVLELVGGHSEDKELGEVGLKCIQVRVLEGVPSEGGDVEHEDDVTSVLAPVGQVADRAVVVDTDVEVVDGRAWRRFVTVQLHPVVRDLTGHAAQTEQACRE